MFSNYLNHHQLPFCLAMVERTDHQFSFVSTSKISQMRLNLGYSDLDSQYSSFSFSAYGSKENEDKAIELLDESDVVIIGAAPYKYLKEAVKKKKMIFLYTERLNKLGPLGLFTPASIKHVIGRIKGYNHKNIFVLCAGAYVATDLYRLGCYKEKTYKWGYFPELITYEREELFQKKKNTIPLILWVGRLIDWKHPEEVISIAKRLKSDGYQFRLDVIGDGEMKAALTQMINDCELTDHVNMIGSVKSGEVRSYMEKANIMLFTSDEKEGWGAVLNEAMNSGLSVVASHKAGSTCFLIENDKNGMVYDSGNSEDLYKKVRYLLDHPGIAENMGWDAYRTIVNEWNAREASKRLLHLVEQLKKGEDTLYKSGPCSKALPIKESDAVRK